MEVTSAANPILKEQANNYAHEDTVSPHGVVPPIVAIKSELTELQIYSSIWGAALAAGLSYLFLPHGYMKPAAAAGAALPWMAGKGRNYQFHVFISTLVNLDYFKT